MTKFHDFFINPEIVSLAEEFGWSKESITCSVKIIEAENWGELKEKTQQNREDYDIIAFRGGNHELNRKAFSAQKIDVVLHPEKGRQDSGMNHVDAKRAAKNNVAVGFSLDQVPGNSKKQSQLLSKWRRNLKLCEKYGSAYIVTTEAENESELRRPRDMASLIKSLGGEEYKCVSIYPEEVLENNLDAISKDSDYAGHEVVE